MISKGETYNHLRGTGKEMRSKVQRSSGNEKLLISEPEMGKKKTDQENQFIIKAVIDNEKI